MNSDNDARKKRFNAASDGRCVLLRKGVLKTISLLFIKNKIIELLVKKNLPEMMLTSLQ